MSLSRTIFAGVATIGLSAGAAAYAQTMSDAGYSNPGQDVAQYTFAAENACRETLKDTTINTEGCVEALQKAINALGTYQTHASETRENVYTEEYFGDANDPIGVRPDERERMGRGQLIGSVYENAANLDLNAADGLEKAILAADHALKGIYVYAATDSLGVHPEGANIGNIIVGLAQQLQAEQSAPAVPGVD